MAVEDASYHRSLITPPYASCSLKKPPSVLEVRKRAWSYSTTPAPGVSRTITSSTNTSRLDGTSCTVLRTRPDMILDRRPSEIIITAGAVVSATSKEEAEAEEEAEEKEVLQEVAVTSILVYVCVSSSVSG